MRLRRPLRYLFLLACIAAVHVPAVRAADLTAPKYDPRHVDGNALGGVIDLSQSWLVYGGDDPSFADPRLDDRKWQVIPRNRRLNRYGIQDQPVVWYRVHVQVPASAKDLALSLYQFRGSVEAYVNGVRIGQLGQMEQGGEWMQNNFRFVMSIPDAALDSGNLVIALRAAIGTASKGEMYGGGPDFATLGQAKLLQEKEALSFFEDLSSNGFRLLLQVITIFVLIALVLALPTQREYLALAVSFVFAAAENVTSALPGVVELLSVPIQLVVEGFLTLGTLLAFLEFLNLALRNTWKRWIRLIGWSLVLETLTTSAWIILIIGRLIPSTPALNSTYSVLQLIITVPYSVLLPGIVFWDWRKRRKYDAGLLLVPVVLMSALHSYLRAGGFLLRFKVISSFTGEVPIHAFNVSWGEVFEVTANVTLLLYIILRVVRTVREGARYASEIEAAQTVQSVLLARSQQATPGFEVETVYLPASEVGGDFFLVSPGADGSLLAIVGDVAGKGMLAAMRVSVILGILRREDSREPGTILARLNDAMMLQGDMGLTTACCVRLERDGRFAIANAGHISPYIAGREVVTAGALPLGIAAEQEYDLYGGVLASGEAFVLMSDGVVEAQSPDRELYGFERLAALTRCPANEIAQTAKLFGQQDDITVMTLRCAV